MMGRKRCLTPRYGSMREMAAGEAMGFLRRVGIVLWISFSGELNIFLD
jgi:hypothetical protein